MKVVKVFIFVIGILGVVTSSCSDDVERVVKETYPNGKEKLVVYLQDTILVKKEKFFEIGKIKSQYNYSDSIRSFEWNKKGELIATEIFSLDDKNGSSAKYLDKVKRLEAIYKDGGIEEMIDYYANGNKQKHSKRGLVTDLDETTEWYESGEKKSFKDQYGKKESYYASGQKKSLTWTRPEDQEKAVQQWWDEGGNLIKEEFWEQGELKETKEY